MDYTPFVLGRNSRDTFQITIETPPYEWDETTTADTLYLRYEDTSDPQLIIRVSDAGGIGRYEHTTALWSARAGATYKAYIIGD
jgi:hypothetical protein